MFDTLHTDLISWSCWCHYRRIFQTSWENNLIRATFWKSQFTSTVFFSLKSFYRGFDFDYSLINNLKRKRLAQFHTYNAIEVPTLHKFVNRREIILESRAVALEQAIWTPIEHCSSYLACDSSQTTLSVGAPNDVSAS